MNSQATERFIQYTHEKYNKWIGNEFGRTILGIFTDEPRLFGRIGSDTIPWSPCLPAAFEADHGYTLESVIEKIFACNRDCDTAECRRAYLSSVSKLIAKSYYQLIRQWCDKHGLIFEGHFSGESEFSKHGFYFGNYFQQARHFHIPGIDTINRQIFPGGKSGNFALLASSLKWLDGKCAALSESGAVYGAGLTLAQMKWIAAYQIIRGIDKIGFMPALYSTAGARRIGVCSDFSSFNPQMTDFDLLVSFIKKASHFCIAGKPLIRVAVFYRSEAINDEVGAADFDQAHEQLCENILNQLTSLVMIDIEHLKQGKVVNGDFISGFMRLSVLIVHAASPLLQEECEVLGDLAKKGLKIVCVGDNFRLSGNVEYIHSVDDIKTNEFSCIRPFNAIDGVRLLAWQNGNDYGILFFNQNSTETTFSFNIPMLKAHVMLTEAEIENRLYNVCYPLVYSEGTYTLHLYPHEVRAFRTMQKLERRSQLPVSAGDYPLKLNWTIFETTSFVIKDDIEVNTTPSPAAANELGDYAAIRPNFSGTLLYKAVFNWTEKKKDRILIDLGRVYYCAKVFVNGMDCGRRAWEPFIFDITDAICDGDNSLEVQITNTLANQWASPEVRSTDFSKYRNSYLEMTQTYIDESCHAGLYGPVRIIVC
jgi:hypothetical protein